MMIRVFFLAFFGLLAFSAAQSAQICTSTSLNLTVTFENAQVMVYTANLHTKDLMGNPKTQLFITDQTYTSVNSSLYYPIEDGIMASIGQGLYKKCYSIGGHCSWLVGNDTVEMTQPVYMVNMQEYIVFLDNLIDDGGISLSTGDLFTEDNSCQEMVENIFNYTFYARQCCTAYKSVPPPPMNTPKCMQFNSSTYIYNNGNFFANLNATFDAIDVGFNISVTSKGSNQNQYLLQGNDIPFSDLNNFGNTSNFIGYLPPFDFKTLFEYLIYPLHQASPPYVIDVGRLIRRNGVYEMEEGVAFTKESPCSYKSATYANNNSSSTAQFCCTKFADN